MLLDRRELLQVGIGAALTGGAWSAFQPHPRPSESVESAPAYSVIPVVGDGKWIWTRPPKEGKGYLESRTYKVKIGIELEGIAEATELMSTTTAPLEYPEQKILEVQIETNGCEAQLRQLAPGAGQLILSAPQIAKGQVISAVAHYTIQLFKQYHAYERDKFPEKQKLPNDVKMGYLQDSPGIQTSSKQVRSLATELTEGQSQHPWDMAQTFAKWVPKNIRPQLGSYTSVTTALDSRRGDCEEMAGVFVALCRAMSIPARLIWVPNHAWAEFYLVDHDGQGHWIPAHTACYPWFGWTGAHELVLQKGDRVRVPERYKTVRLMDDWLQWLGRQPRKRFIGELTPEPDSPGADAGPGARRKEPNGDWKPSGVHMLDKYIRR
jgi:hypothetical protein